MTSTIRQETRTCRCEARGSPDVRPKGRVERRFRSLPVGSRATAVALPIPRVACRGCGVGKDKIKCARCFVDIVRQSGNLGDMTGPEAGFVGVAGSAAESAGAAGVVGRDAGDAGAGGAFEHLTATVVDCPKAACF